MKRKPIMAGFFAGLLLAAGILLAGCSKEEPINGGYEFGGIYLWVGGGHAEMNGMTITIPPESSYMDMDVYTGRLLSVECLDGDDKNITLEILSVYEEDLDCPWFGRQVIRVQHAANPSAKPRSCKYRIYADVADGVMADVTFVQSGRKN